MSLRRKAAAATYNRGMADAANLTDHFLIAMPAMEDPNFARTVAYVCQHTAEGAMALVINRPAGFVLGDILDELELAPANADVAATPVLLGGPVQAERGFILHEPDGRAWDSSFEVSDAMTVTTSRDMLVAIAEGRAPPRMLFALGYAGWDAGQLERELLDNAWLTVPADRQTAFDLPADRRWQAAINLVGFDFTQLSGQAGHA
jgi:putative transcriptional regulator